MNDGSNSAQALVGAVLNGRFRLIRLLGEGGMGAVYEADSLRGEGKRAIKMLHPEFVKEDQILQRFFAEAQATRALAHPNIAQTLDSGTAEDGTPYLVMELLQGTPLSSYLDQGNPIAPQHAVPIILGVLSALTLAHAKGVVHRDLKPDNLFLVRDARGSVAVKVLDFGIAKVMDLAGGMGQKTRTGVLLGTPGYMSPEQIKNSKGVDGRSDLWSVGIVLYELLTAKQPFPADNEFARLTSVLTEEVTPIEKVAPHLASWRPFFQRALAKEPAQRFQSADEMAQALDAMARGGSMPVAPPAASATVPSPQTKPAQFGTVPVMPSMVDQRISAPPLSPSYPAAQRQPEQSAVQHYAAPAWSGPASTPSHGGSYPGAPPYAGGQPMAQPPYAGPSDPGRGAAYATPSDLGRGAAYAGPSNAGRGAAYAGPSGGGYNASLPTHVSVQKPPGTPTLSGPSPSVEVVPAPPLIMGAPWWLVGVVALVAFGIGLAIGMLARG